MIDELKPYAAEKLILQQKQISLALCVILLVRCTTDTATESPDDTPASVSDSAGIDSATETDQAVESGTGSAKEEPQPLVIVKAYFVLLRQGRGPEAIRRYWDPRLAAQRVYRVDFDALSDEAQAKVTREQERLLMGIYVNPATVALMKRVQITNVAESREGKSSVVQFDAVLGVEEAARAQKLVFVNHDGRWRIVDMATSDGQELVSSVVHLIYKSTGSTPLEYATGMTKALPSINEMINASEKARPQAGISD